MVLAAFLVGAALSLAGLVVAVVRGLGLWRQARHTAGTFTSELREAGALVTADQLQPSTTATIVRVRDGETLITDGPFAETKEQLGGYYLLDCGSIDEAIEFAGRIPAAERGAVEVRPLVER